MRHSVREDRTSVQQDDPSSYSAPVSTIENPLMEELHAVSTSSAPAWQIPSDDTTQAHSPFAQDNMFVSIEDELSDTNHRPIAPTNATILTEKEVKEHFSYTDDQLEYRPGMKFSERMAVTFRKVAVWFSDLVDKYVLFMKRHFPHLLEERNVKTFTTVGLGVIVSVLVIIAVLALIF